MEFTILNWNIGGAKYLEEKEETREETRRELNSELKRLIKEHNYPDVVTLQEIVCYGKTKSDAKNLIDDIERYTYYPFELIETGSMSANFKWNKVKSKGDWPIDTYFAQGNAMLIRKDMPHFPFLDLSCSSFFSWDNVSEENSSLLLKLLKNAFGNDLMNNVYLFKWDEIPENDNEKQKLIEFLIQNCNVNWVTPNKIKKINNGGTITISDKAHLFDWCKISEDESEKQKLINFLKQNFNINWIAPNKINKDNNRTIKIYNKSCSFDPDNVCGNDETLNSDCAGFNIIVKGNKITLPIEEEFIKLELDENDEKVTLQTSDGRTYNFLAIKENDQLNIYPNGTKFITLVRNDTSAGLIVKRENGKENKYEKLDFMKDNNTICLYTKTRHVKITLDEKSENATIEIRDEKIRNNNFYNLQVKKEKNKLNIYIPVEKENPHIEKVPVKAGFYFGTRDTEPRAALVAHFIINTDGEKGKPLDIFVVNLHLTTLTSEREGDPKIDCDASEERQKQLKVIFHDMISTYKKWKRERYPERDEKRKLATEETLEREEPVWILTGDFNFTPESEEYERIYRRENFMDVVPIKGSGTKAKGVGNLPTLTLDYIFVGPKFISLDHRIIEDGIKNNKVDSFAKGSDHFPIYAKIPLALIEKK